MLAVVFARIIITGLGVQIEFETTFPNGGCLVIASLTYEYYTVFTFKTCIHDGESQT